MARKLGSSYTLESVVGRGGMGEVWRGRDESGAIYAIKLLLPELSADDRIVARFLRERSILTRVHSPFVVSVRDLVAEHGRLAIVMDFIEGSDLRRELRRRGTFPPAEAVDLTIDVLTGLGVAHEQGVVHRDLKPANVLLDADDHGGITPKVTDFGIAGLIDGSAELTTSQGILGTPHYMAPEMIDGAAVGPPADVYAAGVMLYELLSGVTPFGGRLPLAVLRAHADLAPGRPPGIGDELWAVLAAMLAKDPAARAGVADLRALRPNLAEQPAQPPLTVPPRAVVLGVPAAAGTSHPGAPSAQDLRATEPPARSVAPSAPGSAVAALPPPDGGGGPAEPSRSGDPDAPSEPGGSSEPNAPSVPSGPRGPGEPDGSSGEPSRPGEQGGQGGPGDTGEPGGVGAVAAGGTESTDGTAETGGTAGTGGTAAVDAKAAVGGTDKTADDAEAPARTARQVVAALLVVAAAVAAVLFALDTANPDILSKDGAGTLQGRPVDEAKHLPPSNPGSPTNSASGPAAIPIGTGEPSPSAEQARAGTKSGRDLPGSGQGSAGSLAAPSASAAPARNGSAAGPGGAPAAGAGAGPAAGSGGAPARPAPAPARQPAASAKSLVDGATGACLDSDGGEVYVLGCNNGEYQLWVRDGLRIRNFHTGNCLGAAGGGYSADGSRYRGSVYATACDGGAAQQWAVAGSSGAGTFFRNVSVGECLDSGLDKRSGTGYFVYTQGCNNGDYQAWK